jgi:hypothetical protein
VLNDIQSTLEPEPHRPLPSSIKSMQVKFFDEGPTMMEQSQPPSANKPEFNLRLWLVVLLIVAMLTSAGIGAIFIFDLAPKPYYPTPTGAFIEWDQVSKDVYTIRFGVVTPDTNFKECTIWIQPTMGNGSVQSTVFVPTSGTFVQPATPTAPGIIITDLDADGRIDAGDLVTVTTRSSGYAAVDNGNWTIALIFMSTLGHICSKVFIVSGNP